MEKHCKSWTGILIGYKSAMNNLQMKMYVGWLLFWWVVVVLVEQSVALYFVKITQDGPIADLKLSYQNRNYKKDLNLQMTKRIPHLSEVLSKFFRKGI